MAEAGEVLGGDEGQHLRLGQGHHRGDGLHVRGSLGRVHRVVEDGVLEA